MTERGKIAGVTASTCSPQLSDQQVPKRKYKKKKYQGIEAHTQTHAHN